MPHAHADQVNIFVGSDRSQLLAVDVLKHSISRHTDLKVSVRSMHDLDLPDPKDPRQGKRTGFSFTRFAVPQLMGYEGRALYLDADMLVFRDIRELWSIPFEGKKIIIQESVPEKYQMKRKFGAPKKRVKQCSVMLLDCTALDWDPLKIIAGLDGEYTYEQLLSDMCILAEEEVKYGVPFRWNSLEVYDPQETCLIHYTDMLTQPWVSPVNQNGHLWLNEVRLMLRNGALSWSQLEQEVALGYFRPSILEELKGEGELKPASGERLKQLQKIDKKAGFVMHKEVYEAKRRRKLAIEAYERKLAAEPSSGSIRPATRSSSPTASVLSRVSIALRSILQS